MNNLWKRSLSLLLALVMVVGMFPMGIKAKAVDANSPLSEANGIVWLSRKMVDGVLTNEPSDELSKFILKGNLDNVIRKAAGFSETDDSTKVYFRGFDLGDTKSLANEAAKAAMGKNSKLTELSDEMTLAVKEDKLVEVTINGKPYWIAFVNIDGVTVQVGNEAGYIVIESEGKPENLNELIKAALEGRNNDLIISHGPAANLAQTDHVVNYADVNGMDFSSYWPTAEENQAGGVVLNDVWKTVTIYADEIAAGKHLDHQVKSDTAVILLKDSRDVLTLKYFGDVKDDAPVDLKATHVIYDGEASPVKDPVRKYYNFAGWSEFSKDPENHVYQYVATWEPIKDADGDGVADEEDTFTITYMVGDEVYEVIEDVKYGEGTPAPAKGDPSRVDHNFVGWNAAADFTSDVYATNLLKVTGDATYYAEFSRDPIVYLTVKYLSGAHEYKLVLNDAGTLIVVPRIPAIDGFTLTKVYYTDAQGVHEIEDLASFNFKTNNVSKIEVRYFTDKNGNGIEDGTATDPYYHYDFYTVENDALVYDYQVEGLDLPPEALTKEHYPDVTPPYYWYADEWIIEKNTEKSKTGFLAYDVKPQWSHDKNNNGKPDEAEIDTVALGGGFDKVVDVQYAMNQMILTVGNPEKDAIWYRGYVKIPDLKADGTFVYNANKTIKATPLWLHGDAKTGEMFAYVKDLKLIFVENDGTKTDLEVGCSWSNFEATMGKPEILPFSNCYYQIQVDYAKAELEENNNDPFLIAGRQFGTQKYTDESVYDLVIDAPDFAYDADKVTVKYLAREAGTVKVKTKVLFDYLSDLLPDDYMDEFTAFVPEEIEVSLDELWLSVSESPVESLSAQMVMDMEIKRIINDWVASGYELGTLLGEMINLESVVTEKIQSSADIHVFADGNPDWTFKNGNFNERLIVTYQNNKVLAKKEIYLETMPQQKSVVLTKKGDLKFGYHCFTDEDLLKNIVVIDEETGKPVTGLTLKLDKSYQYFRPGFSDLVTVSFTGNEEYAYAEPVCFKLTIEKVKPEVRVASRNVFVLNGNIDYDQHLSASVTPANAPYIHVIAGLEAEELSFDSNLQLADKEIVAKAWVQMPGVYIALLNALDMGVPTGKFVNIEELEKTLDEYASNPDNRGAAEIRQIQGVIDMIPDFVIDRLGLDGRTYTLQVRLDSTDAKFGPTKPGMYVNFAASTAYLGEFMPDPYGSLFQNENYEVAKMPTSTGELGQVKNLSADAGIVVISPMVPIPNSGGVQIYDSQISNAPNVFIYEYDGNPVNVNLEVAHNGEKLEGAEPFYYGVSTRLDLKQSAPTKPGVYMAGYNYFTTTYNEETEMDEIRRIGSDSCLIIIKQRAADLSITGGIFEFDGTTHHPEIVVTDKHGNKIPNAGMTIISGTVNIDNDGTNVTANDLFGAVNIDFPAGLTIPYLPDGTPYNMDEAWADYRAKVLNKTENDKVTPSDVIAFLEFCGDKATNGANKAMDKFQKMGIAEAVNKVLDKLGKDSKNIDGKVEAGQIKMNNAKVYFDRLIDELRPLEKLDDNVWITFYDLEKLDYSATGAYLYLGMVTDPDLAVVSADGSVRNPDLTVGAAAGLVIIHSADDYVMYDTHVPYNGEPQNIFEVDNTGREDVTVILDRADDAAVAVDTYNKIVHIQVDEKIAQAIIDELNKIPHVELTLESGVYVGTIYDKGENYAARLTDRIIREVRQRAVARISKDHPVVDAAYDKAMSMLDEKISALTTRLSNKLQVLDHMENGTRIVINGKLPVDLGTYEVTRFNFNVSEVNILLDGDVLGAVKVALEEAGYKVTLNDGADGYVVTGYEKVGDVSEVIINKVFRKIESVGTKKIVKTAVESGEELLDKLGRGEIDIDAKTQAALDLMNAKLLVWKDRVLAKMQAVDNVDSYTRVVLNGTLPVDAGTYEFYGFDYDISATRGNLVIEPIYIVVDDNDNSKNYGAEDPELTATVSYYSYNGVAPNAVEWVEIINLPNGLTAADLVSYKVVRKDAGTEEGEKPGLHDLTVTDLTLLNKSGNFKLVISEEDTQDFEIFHEIGTVSKGEWTMSLHEVIHLNHYPTLDGWSEGYDFETLGGAVIWTGTTAPTSASQMDIGAANTILIEGMEFNERTGKYFVRTPEIFAKDTGKIVYMRIYVKSSSDPNEVVYSKIQVYSPARFCYDVMNNNKEDDLKQNACAALLAYSASVQLYAAEEGETPALVTDIPAKWPNAKMEDYEEVLAFDSGYLNGIFRPDNIKDLADTMTGTNYQDISHGKKTLKLVGAIRMSVGINTEIDWDQVEYAKVMFWSEPSIRVTDNLSYEGKTYDYICDLVPESSDAEVKLGDYRAQSHYIMAQDLGDTVYYYCIIKMKGSDEIHRSSLVLYTPEMCIKDHLSDGANVKNVDEVCRRIAVYGEMALRHFNGQNH